MAKFNAPSTLASRQGRATSPIQSTPDPSLQTYNRAPGFAPETKSELFLLGVSNLVGEDTYYESAAARDARFASLVRAVAITDIDWLIDFVRWLRAEANMRSAPLVAAAEGVRARLTFPTGKLWGGNRQLIDVALQRADEPGEFLAYWTAHYGRHLPKPVRRGVADAVARLYHQRSYLKSDSTKRGWRFADVISMTRPNPGPKAELFDYILAKAHGRGEQIPEQLTILVQREQLLKTPVAMRREILLRQKDAAPDQLRAAGFTWESLSGWLQGPMDVAAWQAIIPSMGYMALLRNLRNFDEAGVSDEVAAQVMVKLTDPEQVARSRQLPYRFYSAYEAAPSDRWKHPLGHAMDLSLANIPALPGRSLVLLDNSGSMTSQMSAKSARLYCEVAALFGIGLAKRNEVDLYGFSDHVVAVPNRKGANILAEAKAYERLCTGGSTRTQMAIERTFRAGAHRRVIVISDEQADAPGYGRSGDVFASVPATVPTYTFNIGGYRAAHAPSGGGNRHRLGGLTDHTFRLLPLLEAGRSGSWPWQAQDAD